MIAPPPAPESQRQRPHWQATGEDARLLYFVFGDFAKTADTLALPAGVHCQRYRHAALRSWEGYPLGGSLGALFEHEAPDTLRAAQQAPMVLRIAGEIADPPDLDYLLDTLDAVRAWLEEGAVAVVDPQTSSIFNRRAWQRLVMPHGEGSLRAHVLVLCEDDADHAHLREVSTRGMRKFARPDLRLTGVPATQADAAGVLCQKLVDLLARGGHFADGQQLSVDGLPAPLVARCGGSHDDARFSNTHVELRWPR